MEKYKRKFKEDDEESKAKSAVKELIDTDWGKDNDSQGKASELFKGLSFNNSNLANGFMQDINTYTSSLKDKYADLLKEDDELPVGQNVNGGAY